MKTIMYIVETIKEVKRTWNKPTVDRWDEDYLMMSLNNVQD